MRSVGRAWYVSAALVLFATLAMPASAAQERLTLDGCRVVTDPDLPSFVHYALEDLRGYLRDIAGGRPHASTSAEATARVTILVGPASAQTALGACLQALDPSRDGYLLKSVTRGEDHYLVAAGATPRGTKYALGRLMKSVRVEGTSALVDWPVDVTSQPAFATRGLHFNGWAFGYPYTFRGWREEDWQSYLDILAYQGINLFYLWPFIEIMPVPLSESDQAYLEECRRVVDYAQQKHGMEVWIMQCTNRVARDRCGVEDPRRRPYWRAAQEDLNPGNPEHYRAILESRAALYRIVNNVDGVCNIDSDPGACPGSPLSDYVKVLRGCRDLLDAHNIHGKQTKLVSWMWFGWGLLPQQAFDVEHQRRTIQHLQRELPEPWWLIAGRFPYLPLCRELGVLDKTVLLPYGVIELEPCYPATNVEIDTVRAVFEEHVARYPELAGVMGNVQTPLLQFPHVFFYTSCVWDLEYRQRSEAEVLDDLATQLYPDHHTLVADCYLALKETDPARIRSLADRLYTLVEQDQLGRPGVLGRKVFPDYRLVAQTLILQLKLRAARAELAQMAGDTMSREQCVRLLTEFCHAYLAWDTAHGWHALWGWGPWPLGDLPSDPRYPQLAGGLYQSLGDRAGVEACFAEVAQTLARSYDARDIAAGCLTPLKNAVLAAAPIQSLAQQATATASVSPNAERYPAQAANDGVLSTLYWPGALVEDNTQWLQLAWETPQTFQTVVVRFLQHPSMHGRTIQLQRETAAGTWEGFATTVIPADATTAHSVATFDLPSPVTLAKLRIVNLLDLFEIEIR